MGINNYKASKEQRKKLFGNIKRENYFKMKENISKLSIKDNDVPSTNILKFLERLESEDMQWIDEINDKM